MRLSPSSRGSLVGLSLLTFGSPLIEFLVSAYVGTLNFLAVRAQQRGLNVWSMSVREEAVLNPEAKPAGISTQMPVMSASLPQQAYPQQTYPQQTYPQAYPPAPGPGPTPGAVQV